MKKRFVSLLLSLLMLLTLVPVSAFAEGANISMEVTPSAHTMSTLQVGDTVTVVVSNNAMTVSSFTFNLAFDKDKFTCDSIVGADEDYPDVIGIEKTAGKSTWLNANTKSTVAEANTNGTVGFGWMATEDASYVAGTIVTITFTAKAVGSASFTLNEDSSGTGGYKDTVSTTATTVLKTPIAAVDGAVDQPVKGQALDTTVDLGAVTAYTAAVAWYEGETATGTAATGNAKANQVYTAKITLTAKTEDGESFAGTVDGPQEYDINRVSDSEVTLTKTFAATAAKSLTGIGITTAPTKTAYEVGDTFDKAGMVVTATYDDATQADVTESVTFTPATTAELTSADTSVTVSYTENEVTKTTTQTITVSKKSGSAGLFTIGTLDLTYNGTDRGATIKEAISCSAGSGELGTPEYKFYDTNGNEVAAPTNAGTYTVKATADAGTKYEAVTDLVIGTVTIDPKPLTDGDFTINGTQATYNGSKQNVAYTATGLTEGTDFTVGGVSSATDVCASGSYTVTFTGKGNYTGTVSKDWNLNKATLTVGEAPSASARYGTATNLISVTGGTAKLGDNAVAGTWQNNEEATTVLPVGTQETINVKFVPTTGAGNYEQLTTTVTPTISKADYSYSYTDTTTVVKDTKITSIRDAEASGVNDEKVSGTLTWYTDAERQTQATDDVFAATGSKTLYYRFVPAANSNYNTDNAEGSVSFTVVDIAFTCGGNSVSTTNGITVKSEPTYGDTWKEIITIDSITAKVGDNGDNNTGEYTLSVSGSPNAGNDQAYSVLYNGTIGGKKYKDVTVVSGTVTVARKGVDATTTANVTKTYDSTTDAQNIVFNVTGVGSDNSFTVTVSGNTYADKNVGESKTITLGLTKVASGSVNLDNYKVKYPDVTGAITAKAVPVASVTTLTTGITKVYDTTENVSGNIQFSFTGVGTDGTITVTASANTYNTANVGESKTITLDSKSGTGLENYEVNYPTVTGAITKAPVSVTVSGTASPVTYGTSFSHSADATLLGNDTATYTIKYNGSATKPTDAGTYAVTVDGTNSNYSYTAAGITSFVINKADVSHTAAPELTLRYSNTDARTITAADLGISGVAGTIQVVSTGENTILDSNPQAGADATFQLKSGLTSDDKNKTAVINVSFTPTGTDATNYNAVSSIPVTVKVIDKEKATVSVSMAGWTYGDTQKNPVYSSTPKTGSYTVTYAPQGTENFVTEKPVNAGDYTVKVVYEDADYYGVNTANFTIAKKTLTFTAAVAGKTFDGTAALAEATNVTLVGVVGSDVVSLQSTANTAALVDAKTLYDAGKYSAVVTLNSTTLTGAAKDNYQMTGATYTATGVEVTPLVLSAQENTCLEIGGTHNVEVKNKDADVVAEIKTNFLVKEAIVSKYTDEKLGLASGTTLTTEQRQEKVIEAIKSDMAAAAGQSVQNSKLLDLNVTAAATIVLAYPENVSQAYTIKITHMKNDGTIELIPVTNMAAGIKISVTSGSPYLITWEAPKVVSGGGGGGSAVRTAAQTITTDLTGINLVKVDGKVVDSKYYTISGSNVTLSDAFIKTLSNGKHAVAIENATHVAKATITVNNAATTYKATSGADQVKAPGELVKVTVSSGSAKVVSVYVDGVKLSVGDYIVSGNTVKLQGTYTQKLTSGYHTMQVTYDTGATTSVRFQTQGAVVAPQTADTGIVLYAALALASSTGAGAVWVTARRRKERDTDCE